MGILEAYDNKQLTTDRTAKGKGKAKDNSVPMSSRETKYVK
jgi:hypothetical protein